MAPMLSHQRIGEQDTGTPSSYKRARYHLTSATALARALYSASVLDQARVFCFLQPQDMRLSSTKTQKPQVECRSSRQPA